MPPEATTLSLPVVPPGHIATVIPVVPPAPPSHAATALLLDSLLLHLTVALAPTLAPVAVRSGGGGGVRRRRRATDYTDLLAR